MKHVLSLCLAFSLFACSNSPDQDGVDHQREEVTKNTTESINKVQQELVYQAELQNAYIKRYSETRRLRNADLAKADAEAFILEKVGGKLPEWWNKLAIEREIAEIESMQYRPK